MVEIGPRDGNGYEAHFVLPESLDDRDQNRRTLEQHLETRGYEVITRICSWGGGGWTVQFEAEDGSLLDAQWHSLGTRDEARITVPYRKDGGPAMRSYFGELFFEDC